MRNAVLLAATLAILASSHLGASEQARDASERSRDASVSIRTYNYAQVPDDRMAAARSTADRTFRSAGISLQWVECSVPRSDTGSACREPLYEGRDFVLRLRDGLASDVNRRPQHGSRVGAPTARTSGGGVAVGVAPTALGESVIDRETRGGVLMTVAPRLVWAIAASTATDPATLLGRTIAHELGHLLLGEAEHPRVGVMRAFWSRDELRGIQQADWRFSSREAARMRQGILDRTRAN